MSRKEDGEPLTANPNAFLFDAVTREFGADWVETAAFFPEAKICKVRCRTRECRVHPGRQPVKNRRQTEPLSHLSK